MSQCFSNYSGLSLPPRWRRFPSAALLFVFACIVVGCRDQPHASRKPSTPRRTVRIAAASDLRFALPRILAIFQRLHPAFDVQVTYGSSGNFYAQLANKAPFDLFLSADISYPRKLIDAGLAARQSEFIYAIGYIVIWVPNSSPLNIEQLGVRSLVDPAVNKIAIANPQHAPYGRIAEAALKNLGVYDEIKEKLVLGDNIAQTAQFIESGAADVGVIALSLALAPAMKDQGRYWTIAADAHEKLEQGGVIMNWAQDEVAANSLRSFLLGKESRTVLRAFGFGMPGE